MTADGTENAAALEVFGALLDGYAKACLNLNIVAGRRAASLTSATSCTRTTCAPQYAASELNATVASMSPSRCWP